MSGVTWLTHETADLFARSVRDRERNNTEYPDGFWPWLADNEHIYSAFIEIARRAKRAGYPQWSARAVFHILRWETGLRDGYASAVKINNNASSGLARLAMAEHPDLAGFFCTRTPPARDTAVRLNGRRYSDDDDDVL